MVYALRLALVLLSVAAETASAGMFILHDESGREYEIDSNVTTVGEYRVSRIRWPDNAVNEIHVSGCAAGAGTLLMMDKRGKKVQNSVKWRASDSRLVDRVAATVCRA